MTGGLNLLQLHRALSSIFALLLKQPDCSTNQIAGALEQAARIGMIPPAIEASLVQTLPRPTGNVVQDISATRMWLVDRSLRVNDNTRAIAGALNTHGAALHAGLAGEMAAAVPAGQRGARGKQAGYVAQLIGSMLQKPGPITMAEVQNAAQQAARDNVPAADIVNFMAQMPIDPSHIRGHLEHALHMNLATSVHLAKGA